MVFPVRKVSAFDEFAEEEQFRFFGPTCDSIDAMAGPFTLPGDIDEGDYIEVDNMGAYSISMRTDFNHFSEYTQVIVDNVPSLSLYQGDLEQVPAPLKTGKKHHARLPRLRKAPVGATVKAMIKETQHDAS